MYFSFLRCLSVVVFDHEIRYAKAYLELSGQGDTARIHYDQVFG
jgi:hypothetical protein